MRAGLRARSSPSRRALRTWFSSFGLPSVPSITPVKKRFTTDGIPPACAGQVHERLASTRGTFGILTVLSESLRCIFQPFGGEGTR